MMAISTSLIGRFGNQIFQYAKARAIADRDGLELVTPPWIGEQIFQIPEAKRSGAAIKIEGYGQDQESLFYTRKQVKDWFRLKPEIEAMLSAYVPTPVMAHRRVGDYLALGYVVVSERSYENAVLQFDLDLPMAYITEESPNLCSGLPPQCPWLLDFYLLMKAPVILRGNSSFSWWAATLSNARVFSPVITGKKGGMERDCEFVEGNHPRFCDLSFVTDLHLPE